MYVAMLYTPETKPDQVITFAGVKRYTSYTGYGTELKVDGTYAPNSPGAEIISVIALDAVKQGHFDKYSVKLDLSKAYLGFFHASEDRIATGNWGSGAYGGDKV
jgi:hypothetical protein